MVTGQDGQYVGSELELFRKAVTWKAYFCDRLREHLGGRVLEIGAGLGGTTSALAPAVLGPGDRAGGSWTCLEPDRRLTDELARSIARGDVPSGCEVVTGTLATLDSARTFDCILYVDVLEHIEDDRAELAKAAARLSPGGRLVVLSPAHQWLYSPFDRSIGHFRRYTRRSLVALSPPGCRAKRVEYLDSVGLFASLANRLLLKQSMPQEKQILFWDRALVPVSRWTDPILRYSFGKSVLVVWERERERA